MSNNMNKHNIKVGDTVRIIGNTSGHYFEIGQLVMVDEICYEGCEDEHLKCSGNNKRWYVKYDDIEPVTPEHTFDGWAVYDEKDEMIESSLFLDKEYMLILYATELKNGHTIKPVTVTVKIKRDGKED